MVNKKYVVKLTTEDKEYLQNFVSKGKRSAENSSVHGFCF